MKFTPEELDRYSRHILLPEIGIEGQQKLKAAKVLVIGAGGLGCPALLYLVAAGVGTIGIIDPDIVDSSNLQRQVLYREDDLGQPKVDCAKRHLTALNPFVRIKTYHKKLSPANALKIIRDFDLVVDGSDNFATRYLVNDACVLSEKPFVYGAIHRFSGQIAVFNYENGPTYRCLFPEPPPADEVPSCSEAGVLGVLPGIIGSFQASEAIKIISGIGEVASGSLLLMDALTLTFNKISIKKDETRSPVRELIDYDAFCNSSNNSFLPPINEISIKEFQQMFHSKADYQLIDVREPIEYEKENINGLLIPLAQLKNRINEITTDKKVIVHCQSGGRSKKGVEILKQEYGFKNIYNLRGGLNAWKNLIG